MTLPPWPVEDSRRQPQQRVSMSMEPVPTIPAKPKPVIRSIQIKLRTVENRRRADEVPKLGIKRLTVEFLLGTARSVERKRHDLHFGQHGRCVRSGAARSPDQANIGSEAR